MRVQVLNGPDALADFAAATVAGLLRKTGDRATLGLAGGSTPRTTYTRLAHQDVRWEAVHAWVADERWVPPDDPDNNFRMARTALLDRVPAHTYPIRWSEDLHPQEAAARYEHVLVDVLASERGHPRPDVVMLGIGEDGHTASLFPHTSALEVEDHWYVANWVSALQSWRLTATLPLLRSARHIVFLAAGTGKAAVLAEILEGDTSPPSPARMVTEGEAEVTWLIDRAAAADLRDTQIDYL